MTITYKSVKYFHDVKDSIELASEERRTAILEEREKSKNCNQGIDDLLYMYL